MHTWRAVAALGFAHAAIDATTGFALASLVNDVTPVRLTVLILAYNAIAFALQPLVGLLVDRVRAPHVAAVLGMTLAGSGMFAAGLHPWVGVVLMGIGSSMFHVGGGALACAATPGRAVGPGFFTGPGVIGLSVGIVCATAINGSSLFIVAALMVAIIVLTRTTMNEHRAASFVGDHEGRPYVMVAIALLVLGTAARSGVWSATQTIFMHDVDVLLLIGIAAGIGKMLGGIAGDTFGARTIAVGSLVIACGFVFAPSIGLFVIGVLLLQSSTPIILAEVVHRMPRFPATGTGLVLGLGLAIGGALLMFHTPEVLFANATVLLIGATIAFAVGLTLIRRRPSA